MRARWVRVHLRQMGVSHHRPLMDKIRELDEEFPECVIHEEVLPSPRGCQPAEEQERQSSGVNLELILN